MHTELRMEVSTCPSEDMTSCNVSNSDLINADTSVNSQYTSECREKAIGSTSTNVCEINGQCTKGESCDDDGYAEESDVKAAVEEGQKLVEEGHRLLLAGKYDDAVNAYSEALESLTYAYGEVAWECAYPYYFYGRALWLLASQQGTNVFGDTIQKVADVQPKKEPVLSTKPHHHFSGDSEEYGGETDEKGKGPAIKATRQQQTVTSSPSNGAIIESTDSQPQAKVKFEINNTEPHPESSGNNANNDGDDGENEDDEENGEEGEEEEEEEGEDEEEENATDNLELAWQALDTARLIFERHPEQTGAVQKLSQTHMLLGDISMENDNFAEAARDYELGLNIKRRLLEPHDRELAEILYKMVMAFEQDSQYETAAKYLSDAMDVLRLRIEFVEKNMKDAEEKESMVLELEDIKSLFPEMEAKLEELRKPEEKMSLPQLLMESIKSQIPSTSDCGSSGSTGKMAVNDLTNFVRKKPTNPTDLKRKADEDSLAEKKLKEKNTDVEQ